MSGRESADAFAKRLEPDILCLAENGHRCVIEYTGVDAIRERDAELLVIIQRLTTAGREMLGVTAGSGAYGIGGPRARLLNAIEAAERTAGRG